MINKVLKEHACAAFCPIILRQLGPNEPDEVSGEDRAGAGQAPPVQDVRAPAAPPAPPVGGTEPKVKWDKAKGVVIPLVKQVLATNPPNKPQISAFISEALQKENAGDYAGALDTFGRLAPILKAQLGSRPSPAAAAPPPPKSPARPPAVTPQRLLSALNRLTPAVLATIAAHPDHKTEIAKMIKAFQGAEKAGQVDEAKETLAKLGGRLKSLRPAPGGGRAASKRTLPVWTEAKDAVGEQLNKLQSSLKANKNPLMQRIADQGLNAITGRLQVGWQAALMEFDSGGPEQKAKAKAALQAGLAEMRSFLGSHPALPLLEQNPVGVAVTIRATLGAALTAIEEAIAS